VDGKLPVHGDVIPDWINMKFRESHKGEEEAVVQLFTMAFTDSEGEAEGKLIGELARELFETPGKSDQFNFVAESDGRIVGSVFFSRMVFGNEDAAFILAPAAVHSACQGKGTGQALIRHGLHALRKRGVNFVLTYGDPKFYEKAGFRPVSSKLVSPPFELSRPEGWLGQSLCERPVESLRGASRCVAALNKPVYW